jgi:hypothetical protein
MATMFAIHVRFVLGVVAPLYLNHICKIVLYSNLASVAEPHHFDTVPAPGWEKDENVADLAPFQCRI